MSSLPLKSALWITLTWAHLTSKSPCVMHTIVRSTYHCSMAQCVHPIIIFLIYRFTGPNYIHRSLLSKWFKWVRSNRKEPSISLTRRKYADPVTSIVSIFPCRGFYVDELRAFRLRLSNVTDQKSISEPYWWVSVFTRYTASPSVESSTLQKWGSSVTR